MHVFLIAALTIDGFIAQDKNQVSTKWTSKEDFKFFQDRTKQAGVLIMGRTTFETIGRALSGRKIIVLSSQPKPTTYQHLNADAVEYTSKPPSEVLAELEKAGQAEVAICGGSTVYTQFVKAGLVQTFYLTIEPVAFGQGISLFSEPLEAHLTLNKLHTLSDQTIVLEYSC